MRLCCFYTPAGYPRCSPSNTQTNFGETKLRYRLERYLSKPFFFNVIHVEPVVDHPVTWNELLDVIFHVLLEFQGQIAQMQVAFFIVPSDNPSARTFFCMFANPRRDLIIGRAGGDERSEVVVVDLSKLKPALIERTIGMVFAFPANKHGATFIYGTRRQHIARQRGARAARELFSIAQIAGQQFHFFEILIHMFLLFALGFSQLRAETASPFSTSRLKLPRYSATLWERLGGSKIERIFSVTSVSS